MTIDSALLRQLRTQRGHVLAAVDGLDDDQLGRTAAPSGWTIAQLIQHLTLDDEMFWISGVIGGDPRAAQAVANGTDGWRAPVLSGSAAIRRYREECDRSDAVLARVDLADAPGWWPEGLFGGWRLRSNAEVLLHHVTETATHAGHLDLVREAIDGRQHLVV
jgi:hypothetical protein